MTALDPVTRELLWNRFSAITEEMAIVEYRASFSPVIREMLDYSCGMLDRDGTLLAASEHIPAQIGTLDSALAAALVKHGPLNPGDVVIGNDPYNGATHLPDVEIFLPVYHGESLLGYTASVAHYIDIGGISSRNRGAVPGVRNAVRDVFEEGQLLPNVKLFEGGRRNDAVWDIIMANVRDPEAAAGDLTAQLAACQRGAQRLVESVDRYGLEAVLEAMVELREDTSRRALAEMRTWPKHEVYREGWLDGDGLNFTGPVKIAVTLQVKDDLLHIDLSNSSQQVAGAVNIPWASTHAAAYYATRCMLGNDIRQNEGFTRHVRLSGPHGLVVRPSSPAAVVMRHFGVQRLTDTIFAALGDLLPERAMASSHVSFPGMSFRATDPRDGRQRQIIDMVGGGGGARANAAGDNAIDSYTSNCAALPAEVVEIDYPWRVIRSELVEGSGGAGRFSGGMGVRREYQLLAEFADGEFFAEQMGAEFGAEGRNGGGRGAPAAIELRRSGSDSWEKLSHENSSLRLERGDTIALITAGGGGYGQSGDGSAERFS